MPTQAMPAEQELSVGDKVTTDRIREIMTVAEIYGIMFVNRYRCTWAASDGSGQHELFRRNELRLATDHPVA